MFKMNDPVLLEFCRVRKQFGPVIALNDVSFSVRAGEVHCLVGENGAGKSTLIKILAGAYSIDGGELRIDGKPVRIETPAQAAAYGISVVYQDVTNVDKLSIADNIVLGSENSRFGFNQKKKNYEFVRPFLQQVGLEVDPSALMETLSIAQKQMVMIAKALSKNARLIVLDEPTAMLNEQEVHTLFQIICSLRDRGITVVYISHRMEEIYRIGDRVTVLKDGGYVGTWDLSSMDLSPAGVIALTSVVFAKLCVSGISIPLAALLSLLVGVAAGTFSGLLVVLANVPPMIATLGTWYITKGLAYAISNSYAIVQGLPANFGWVNRYVGPFPLMVVIAVAVFAVFYILLNRTLLGKYAYAIGGNSETARLSGIKVNLVRCVLYILTALMSSFVGILMSSRINSGDPNLSTSGIEFEIIVAIILGGTSLLGGQGSLIGTLIGALILGNLSNGMNLLGIGTVYQFIVEGAVLVVAVVLDLTLKGNGLRIKKLRRSN